MTQAQKIRIGISSCLLGNPVRYDGGHKLSAYIQQTLGRFFEFVPYCPEVAIGLGIPRPPIQLTVINDNIHAVGVKDRTLDVSQALRGYGKRIARDAGSLSGFIFKSKSPSCGMERVKVYTPGGIPRKNGAGLFAAALLQHCPALPAEEEGRLMDPVLRENFIERVFAYQRWQACEQALSPARLIEFHTRHKYILLSHDETAYRSLGQLVSGCTRRNLAKRSEAYIEQFMSAMRKKATRRRHSNVLMHIMGYFKKALDTHDKQELLEIIEAYRKGEIPLIVPVTLLHHYQRKYPDDYIAGQYYLNPHPRELMLRNLI